MKILFTASECVPFIKTGGLADVVGALAPVLAKQGHDVRVMLPLYAAVPKQYVDQMTHVTDFEVALGWRRQYCGIELLEKDGVKFYFVDNKFYFGRPYIYGMGGDEYERFGFFCRAALNALPLLDFQPDVIHAHDWQSGMVPALLKIQYAHLPFFANIKTMFTIHNLQYQGVFGIREVQDVLGLGDSLWAGDKLECYGCANFMKAALVYSDIITTVSPSYAEEIQTAYYGERLDGLLRARKREVFGVLNGIDMADYNPATDARIPAEYTADDLSGKSKCKAELQEKLGRFSIKNTKICEEPTGDHAFFLLDSPEIPVKQFLVSIEESHPLGRLFNLDVCGLGGVSVKRQDLHLLPRTCLVCGGNANICQAKKRHSMELIQWQTARLFNDHFRDRSADLAASAAVRGLLYEVSTTPKPGLVDRNNSGSHSDMDFFTFLDSSASLIPWFREFFCLGWDHADEADEQIFEPLCRAARGDRHVLRHARDQHPQRSCLRLCDPLRDAWKSPCRKEAAASGR